MVCQTKQLIFSIRFAGNALGGSNQILLRQGSGEAVGRYYKLTVNSWLCQQVVVPIFSIFDYKKAVEFYVDRLGFKIVWERKFDEESRLYIQVSTDGIVLHLSEHRGDSTPGSKAYITIDDVQFTTRIFVRENTKNTVHSRVPFPIPD